jgi:hypothetical protein
MSSLLKDAIVDAKALREAALKTAETTVIDKYAQEVRETLSHLLEQDDLGLGEMGDFGSEFEEEGPPEETVAESEEAEEVASDIPLAATDGLSENEGEHLSNLPTEGENVEVEINLDALQEAIQNMQDEQEYEFDEAVFEEALSEEVYTEEEEEGEETAEEEERKANPDPNFLEEEIQEEEEMELSEELIDSIVEELTVDMSAELSGWAGRSSDSMKYELEKGIAQRRSTGDQEELDILKKAQEELVFENSQLKKSLKQHKQAVTELKEATQHVNLSNARLLYTNRVLRNTSLNERQKTKIADAISRAGSVTEAKMIHQTLETTVKSTPRREPKSLSEAIGRPRASVIRASRKESTSSDPLADRMKRLAGIK